MQCDAMRWTKESDIVLLVFYEGMRNERYVAVSTVTGSRICGCLYSCIWHSLSYVSHISTVPFNTLCCLSMLFIWQLFLKLPISKCSNVMYWSGWPLQRHCEMPGHFPNSVCGTTTLCLKKMSHLTHDGNSIKHGVKYYVTFQLHRSYNNNIQISRAP